MAKTRSAAVGADIKPTTRNAQQITHVTELQFGKDDVHVIINAPSYVVPSRGSVPLSSTMSEEAADLKGAVFSIAEIVSEMCSDVLEEKVLIPISVSIVRRGLIPGVYIKCLLVSRDGVYSASGCTLVLTCKGTNRSEDSIYSYHDLYSDVNKYSEKLFHARPRRVDSERMKLPSGNSLLKRETRVLRKSIDDWTDGENGINNNEVVHTATEDADTKPCVQSPDLLECAETEAWD